MEKKNRLIEIIIVILLVLCLGVTILLAALRPDGAPVIFDKDALSDTSFSPDAEKALNKLISSYGNGKKDGAYVVSDFDNTASVFDITYQCSVYQTETMSFNMNPSELGEALAASTDPDDTEISDRIYDILVAYEVLYYKYGPFDSKGLTGDKLSILQEDKHWIEFSAKMKSLYLYIEDTLSSEEAYRWITYWYAGMTSDEVYDLFRRSCEYYMNSDTETVRWSSPSDIKTKSGIAECEFTVGVSVTDDVKAMFKAFDEAGIDVWICSASPADGVRAAVDVFGLSDYVDGVIGITMKDSGGIYTYGEPAENGYPWRNGENGWEMLDMAVTSLPAKEGKSEAVKNALVRIYGCGPLACFMDSSGDFNFCTEFDSVKLVICFNTADGKITDGGTLIAAVAQYQKNILEYNLEKASEAGDTLYILQGRDENGKRTLRPSEKTVKLGETEEKLFAGKDGDLLYGYICENSMTTSDALNLFCMHTPADSVHNPIKTEYGFLESYSGYHNIKD